MTTILTPYMREVIDLFEANGIHVNMEFSALHSLKIDSPDLGEYGPGRMSVCGLPLRAEDEGHSVVVEFRLDAPEGMSFEEAKDSLLAEDPDLTYASPLLAERGYAMKADTPFPEYFAEDDETEYDLGEPEDESPGKVYFDFRKTGLTPKDSLAEVQWALAQARRFWPDLPWKD